jgi:hypothetical protein
MEMTRKWHVLDNKQKMWRVFQKLVPQRMEIKVRIRGAKNPFASKLLKIVEAETLLELENSEMDTEGMVRDLAGDRALVVIDKER